VPPTFKKSRRFQNEPSLSIAFVSYIWRDLSIGSVAWGIISGTSSDGDSNERSPYGPIFAKPRSWQYSALHGSTSDLTFHAICPQDPRMFFEFARCPGGRARIRASPQDPFTKNLLNIRISYAGTSRELRFGREDRQVDALHRIPCVKKIMD